MPGSKPGALPLGDAPVGSTSSALVVRTLEGYGRGGWIRTNACQDQNLVPYRLATPLYRTTLVLRTRFLCHPFQASVQHRDVAAAGHETRQSGWKLAADFISLALVWEAPKHTSSSAGHPCLNEFVQQAQSVTNFGITLLDHRLTVVMTAPARRLRTVMAGVLRVNSGSANISAVLTETCGAMTRNQGSGRSTGCRRSPTPSAKAARPRTNTGTSAPRFRPSSARRSSPSLVFHRWSRPTRVVAASELPPPIPPPMGRRLVSWMSAQRTAAFALQQACGTDDQVAVVVDAWQFGEQANLPVLSRTQD